MDAKQGQEIDHIDRNKTNNRRANLRVVTHSENLKNVDYTSRHAAGNPVYATWEKRCNKWRAYQYLRKDDGKRKQIYLGVFSSKDEALACPPAQKHS